MNTCIKFNFSWWIRKTHIIRQLYTYKYSITIMIMKISNWISGLSFWEGIPPWQAVKSIFFATEIEWVCRNINLKMNTAAQPTESRPCGNDLQWFMAHISHAAYHSNAAELVTSWTIRQHGNNDFTASTQANAADNPLVSLSVTLLYWTDGSNFVECAWTISLSHDKFMAASSCCTSESNTGSSQIDKLGTQHVGCPMLNMSQSFLFHRTGSAGLGNLWVWRVATVRDQDAASQLVDILHLCAGTGSIWLVLFTTMSGCSTFPKMDSWFMILFSKFKWLCIHSYICIYIYIDR